MGVIQEIDLILNQAKVADLEAQLNEVSQRVGDTITEAIQGSKADEAAKEQGTKAIAALRAQLERDAKDLRSAVARGLLSPQEAEVLGTASGKAFSEGITRELERLRKAGVLSTVDLGLVGKRLQGQFGGGGLIPPIDIKPPAIGPFEGFFGRIKSLALSAGGVIAGIFTLSKLKTFAQESVREFLADERALNDLRVQVERTGVSFADVRGEVEATGDAWERAGRGQAGDMQRALGQLIGVSGNYEKSLANVTLVSDLAAAKQISLEQATSLVGRAMVGQAGPLRRYGILVKEGEDAVLAINEAVGGFVEKQGPSLTRSLTILSASWSSFKSAIGEALVSAGGGSSAMDLLSESVQAATGWVREHREQLSELGRVVVQVAGTFVKDLAAGIRSTGRDLLALGALLDTLHSKLLRIDAFELRVYAAGSRIRGDAEGVARRLLAAQQAEDEADRLENRAASRRARLTFGTVEGGGSTSAPPAAAATGTRPVGGAVRPAGSDREGGEDALDKRIKLLAQAIEFDRTKAEATEQLTRLEASLTDQLDRGNLSLEKTVDLEQKRAAVRKALGLLDSLEQEIALLGRAAAFTSTKAQATSELIAIEARLIDVMARGGLTLAQQVDTEQKLLAVREALGRERALAERPIAEQIRILTGLTAIDSQRSFALAKLLVLETALREELERGLVPAARRLEIAEQQAEIDKAQAEAKERAGTKAPSGPIPRGPGQRDLTIVDPEDLQAAVDAINASFEDLFDPELLGVREFFTEVFGTDFQTAVEDAAFFIGEEFDAVFERLFEDGATLTQTLAGIGKGLAAGMLNELKQLAKGKQQENLARGVEETALGIGALFFNPPKAAAHFASAGQHYAAAAAWSALGAAGGAGANALSGRGGGGGGGRGDEFRDRGSDRLDPGGRGRATIHIHGGLLNTDDVRQMDALGEAIRELSGRHVEFVKD